MSSLLLIVAAIAALVTAVLVTVVLCYKKVGPNEVLIVSGRKQSFLDPDTGESITRNFAIYHGGGTLVMPFIEKIDRMSVELMTLEIKTPEFFTKFGVPIIVDGIAQIKVLSTNTASLATAAEMFLSKSRKEMNVITHQMMQGHLRAVISTLPFEEIHAQPEIFAKNVQRLTGADLANMGIQVVSFTIREIRDPSGFLQALGRPQLAEVKKTALLGEAKADRDAQQGSATARREASVTAAQATQASKLAQTRAEMAIAEAQADKDRRAAELEAEVARALAQKDLAHEIETTKAQQILAEERLNVSKTEHQRQIEIEDLEILRKEKELVHVVQKPAEAEGQRIKVLAQAEKYRQEIMATAQAEADRLRGKAHAEVIAAEGSAVAEAIEKKALAEAAGIKARLLAEAEGMRRKAEAWETYGAAALSDRIIEQLPELAAAVAAPLEKIDRIVLVNNGPGEGGIGLGRVTQGVTDVITQIPALAQTLSGVDLGSLVKQIKGITLPSQATPPAVAAGSRILENSASPEETLSAL